jgi:transcriptional regulator NrdR family protein
MMAVRTELIRTCRDRTIAIDEYDKTAEEFEEEINKPQSEEVNQKYILSTGKEMNQSLLVQVVDYEQELYEKDQYIQALENEIRGLKESTYCLREKIL